MKTQKEFHRIKDENSVTCFHNSRKSYKIFYDNQQATQIRFYLEDSNKEIKNKLLILSTRHFKDKVSLHYEKHFKRQGKKIIESYVNDELEAYYEISNSKFVRITEGYSPTHELFSREIIEYDNFGKPISEKQMVKNFDGTKLEYENKLI